MGIAKELLQKELDVNLAEQALLHERMQLIKCQVNDIPSWDPQYTAFYEQIRMDQIEWDELKNRQEELLEQLANLPRD